MQQGPEDIWAIAIVEGLLDDGAVKGGRQGIVFFFYVNCFILVGWLVFCECIDLLSGVVIDSGVFSKFLEGLFSFSIGSARSLSDTETHRFCCAM